MATKIAERLGKNQLKKYINKFGNDKINDTDNDNDNEVCLAVTQDSLRQQLICSRRTSGTFTGKTRAGKW